ncbi:hypothetical protein [Actinospica sp.]|jgi:hypothetical protein|uniref:hypothetical protein n=1 Tax=Actinospica sp. TaxID=1872142 RepID=UPI002CB17222|nr:hypothetical protein [Actinospica sp.]HWG25146.1 hypothetical protein [Actinospica sp.]
MTLADALTLCLSIVALVFSITTFLYSTYEQYLKAPKLQLVLGRELKSGYLDGTRKLGFWAPVVLANQGAVDAVVLEIRGTLTRPDTTTVGVEWYTVGDYDGGLGQFVPRGWTDTLIVSSRKATTAWIGLRTKTDLPYPVPAGVYTLALEVDAPKRGHWAGRAGRAASRPATSWTGQLTLQESVAEASDSIKIEPGLNVRNSAFNLRNTQMAEVTGATPRSVTALIPGLKDLLE